VKQKTAKKEEKSVAEENTPEPTEPTPPVAPTVEGEQPRES
jgi:hypothetical protein